MDVCRSEQVEQESRSGSTVGIGVELGLEFQGLDQNAIGSSAADVHRRCRQGSVEKKNLGAVGVAGGDCRAGGQRWRG